MAELIRVRNFFDENTPLGDIPGDWLRNIEPKVIRGSFRPCWMWDGAMDAQGYPVMWDAVLKQNTQVKRFIARMFWRCPQEFKAKGICGKRNCVNPAHISPIPLNVSKL